MKKLLVSIIVLCVLSLIGIYALIPARIAFSKVIIVKTKLSIANRFLMDESKWGKWFPPDSDKNVHAYKNYSYLMGKKMLNAGEVSISNKQLTLSSLIHIISINTDSVAIEWKSEMPESTNPLSKLRYYIKAKRLQEDMTDILNSLKSFLEQNEKVYGVYIHEVISKDSTLIATSCVTSQYPSTTKIYDLISSLKEYIIHQNAKENNFPMLHVKKVNDTTYNTLVAIPVNKFLEGNGTIFNKRFVPWKVLTAEVKGGNYTVREALNQMKIYISDYHREAMAIPFESLVTNRSEQPDTLKWITRIYTPVK